MAWDGLALTADEARVNESAALVDYDPRVAAAVAFDRRVRGVLWMQPHAAGAAR
jgi:hypothetical protein